ncbi:hypothetical protein HHI36_000204, partial [Cryptolaemus montrouzieri]
MACFSKNNDSLIFHYSISDMNKIDSTWKSYLPFDDAQICTCVHSAPVTSLDKGTALGLEVVTKGRRRVDARSFYLLEGGSFLCYRDWRISQLADRRTGDAV